MVWRVTTHTRRKGGDSFCYRLIFYIIADEQNTHVCSQSFFSSEGVSAFDTSGLRQKIIASPAGRRDLRPGRTQPSIKRPTPPASERPGARVPAEIGKCPIEKAKLRE